MVTLNDVYSGRTRYTLRLIVTEGTVDIPNNRSIANWSLRIVETTENGSYWGNKEHTWSTNIGGQTASGKNSYDFRNYDELILGSGSYWMTHNTNGSKTISIGASAGGGTVIGSASVAGSLVMSTIPRASIATWAVPTGNKYIGTSYTLNTNRASTGFLHTMTYDFGGASGEIGTEIGGTVDWTPPVSLLAEIPNSASGSGTITTKTYSGGTLIGETTSSIILTAALSVVPTLTGITDAEGTSIVASQVGAYVQNKSKLVLGMTGAGGVSGSSITSYKLEVAGQTINAISGTTPAAISASGTVTITATVTDSRGRSKVVTKNINVLPYTPPKINSVTLRRSNSAGTIMDEGTYIRVDLNASVASLVNGTQKNSLRYKMKTRLHGTTTAWSSIAAKFDVNTGSLTFNSNNKAGTYPVDQAFDVLIEVYDSLATITQNQGQVATATIFMHWDGNTGLGILKYRENGALDVGGDIYQNAQKVVDVSRVATESQAGVGEIATQVEADAGLDDTRILTPKKLRRSSGSRIMTPTATNGVVQSDGSVLFTAQSVPNMDGIFTDDFNRYRILFEFDVPSNGGLWGRFRSAGTDRVTANYQVVRHYGFGNASLSVSAVNVTFAELAGGSAVRHDGELLIGRARANTPTSISGRIASMNSSNSAIASNASGWYNVNQIMDGFAFSTTSGGGLTLSGRATVYGLA